MATRTKSSTSIENEYAVINNSRIESHVYVGQDQLVLTDTAATATRKERSSHTTSSKQHVILVGLLLGLMCLGLNAGVGIYLHSMISHNDKRQSALEQRNDILQLEMKALIKDLEGSLKTRLDSFEKTNLTCLKGACDLQGTHIGFSADQNKHGDDVQPGQAIIFHKVSFNQGGGFNISTGMFRCPLSGTYFFIFSICSYLGNRIHAYLVKNGNIQFEVIGGTNGSGHGDDTIGTGSAIFRCRAGDLVWGKVKSGYRVGAHTFLTGYLLWVDN